MSIAIANDIIAPSFTSVGFDLNILSKEPFIKLSRNYRAVYCMRDKEMACYWNRFPIIKGQRIEGDVNQSL